MSDFRRTLSSVLEREKIARLIKSSPSPSLARSNVHRLIEAGGVTGLNRMSEQHLPILLRLLGGSAYLSEVLIRRWKKWPEIFLPQINIRQKTVAEHLAELKQLQTK